MTRRISNGTLQMINVPHGRGSLGRGYDVGNNGNNSESEHGNNDSEKDGLDDEDAENTKRQ